MIDPTHQLASFGPELTALLERVWRAGYNAGQLHAIQRMSQVASDLMGEDSASRVPSLDAEIERLQLKTRKRAVKGSAEAAIRKALSEVTPLGPSAVDLSARGLTEAQILDRVAQIADATNSKTVQNRLRHMRADGRLIQDGKLWRLAPEKETPPSDKG